MSTNLQSFINTAKLFTGNAYISLPHTFSLTGWLGGITLFSVLGPINCYSMLINLKVADKYPECKSYSELSFKVFGSVGKMVVDISILIMQVSLGISYSYFIAE
mmetsp:Transcript_37732/g.36185  ORF Transcript_37732/g.36185 Transcript_37732/m.36185 type:complete len:104 (-) Transcript_37732:16-327(-)